MHQDECYIGQYFGQLDSAEKIKQKGLHYRFAISEPNCFSVTQFKIFRMACCIEKCIFSNEVLLLTYQLCKWLVIPFYSQKFMSNFILL